MVSGRVSLTGRPVDGCRCCCPAGRQMQTRRRYDVACGCLCQSDSSRTRGELGVDAVVSCRALDRVWGRPSEVSLSGLVSSPTSTRRRHGEARGRTPTPQHACAGGSSVWGRRPPLGAALLTVSPVVQKPCAFWVILLSPLCPFRDATRRVPRQLYDKVKCHCSRVPCSRIPCSRILGSGSSVTRDRGQCHWPSVSLASYC